MTTAISRLTVPKIYRHLYFAIYAVIFFINNLLRDPFFRNAGIALPVALSASMIMVVFAELAAQKHLWYNHLCLGRGIFRDACSPFNLRTGVKRLAL
jgi:hypothetical protein